MRKFFVSAMLLAAIAFCGSLTVAAPSAKASTTSVMVGQCVEFAACWNGPYVPFSGAVTGAQLSALGLGSSQPLAAAQTACCIIRLSDLTATFQTPGGPVVETLPEFSGGSHSDPCNYCEVDTVGMFFIPVDATSAIISGTFGNSFSSSSAGVDVWFGPAPGVPEPAMWAMLIAGFGLVGSTLRRRPALAA